MSIEKYCLCLDLKNDPNLIEEYKTFHAPGNVWPEILESIRSAGILNMEIYLNGNRMFMIMTVSENFDWESKAQADRKNEKVQAWEKLMWKYQEALPWAGPSEKWLKMEQIFNLSDH